MKRIFFSICAIMLVAVSCSKNEIDTFETNTYELLLSGDIPARTSLGTPDDEGNVPFLWASGDQLGVYVLNGTTVTEKNVYALVQKGDGKGPGNRSADFSATLSNIKASTAYDVRLYYPFSKGAGTGAAVIAHAIPSLQSQAVSDMSEHFRLSGAFAYATSAFTTPADLTDYAPEVSFSLSHKTAYLWLRLYALDESLTGWKVKSVKVTAPEGTDLAGTTSFDTTSESFTLASDKSNSVSVNISGGIALSTSVSGNAYMVVFPASVAGKTLTFTYILESSDATQIKIVTHTRKLAEGISAFEEGSVNRFTERIPSADAEGWVYSTSAIDLSAAGTANCYIVSAQGNYSFDATVIGNGDKGILTNHADTKYHVTSASIAPVSAELIWQTKPGLISSVALAGGKVTFTKPDAQEGNALIAVKDAEGTIIWSWHIWCTDMGPAQQYVVQADKKGTNDTYKSILVARAGKTYMMMDRDLGATVALSELTTDQETLNQTLGLYYQFGRKDPFVGPSELKDGITTFAKLYDAGGNEYTRPDVVTAAAGACGVEYSIKNLTTFLTAGTRWYNAENAKHGYNLWGLSEAFNFVMTTDPVITKSIYDPCPPGYTVPLMEPFYATAKSASNAYGVLLSVSGGAFKSFYPFAGAITHNTGAINAYVGGTGGVYYFHTRQRGSANANPATQRILNSGIAANPNHMSANYGMNIRCMQEY